MEIKCGKCGLLQDIEPEGDKTEYSCSKCGNLITVASTSAETLISQEMETPPTSGKAPVEGDTRITDDPMLTAQTNMSKKTGLLKPGERFAGYIIDRKIGRGGMGVVYKATQVSLNRPVALKILKRELCDVADYEERFIREARSAGRLNHPNILQIYDVSVSNNIYFFSMEYIEGESLGEILEKRKKLSLEQAITVVTAVSRALKEASNNGIVHRDIKPDNIMLTKSGKVKVADFGLARVIDSDEPALTKPGMTLGTPNYMAPEQINAREDIDIRADIYSLGCTFYHLITGETPFKGNNTFEILEHHMYDSIEFAPGGDIPEAVKAVILQMTSKAPEERFSNMSAVLHALVNLKKGVPSEGENKPKPSMFKRLKPYLVGGLAMLIILIILGNLDKSKKNNPDNPQTQNNDDTDDNGTSKPAGRSFLDIHPIYFFSLEKPNRFFTFLTDDVNRVLMGKLGSFAAISAKQKIAEDLNIKSEFLPQVFSNTNKAWFFSVDGKPVGFIDMTPLGINTLFSSQTGGLSIEEHKGKRYFKRKESDKVYMDAGKYIVIADDVDSAFNLIQENIYNAIPRKDQDTAKMQTLASGVIQGAVFKEHLSHLTFLNSFYIDKAHFFLGENSKGVLGNLKLLYKNGNGPDYFAKRRIPREIFHKNWLPAGGVFYAATFLPEPLFFKALFKNEAGKKEKGNILTSKMFTAIIKTIRDAGVNHAAFGIYSNPSPSFLIETNPGKSGTLKTKIDKLGFTMEELKRPVGNRRNGPRRPQNLGNMYSISDQQGTTLYILLMPGKIYLASSTNQFQKILIGGKGFSNLSPKFEWEQIPAEKADTFFYGVTEKYKGSHIQFFVKDQTINAAFFLSLISSVN